MTKNLRQDTTFDIWNSFSDRLKKLETALGTLDTVHLIGNSANDPVAVAFQNGWVNYVGITGFPAGFWKDLFGVVHLQGIVSSGTVGSGTPIFTLPATYRPPYEAVLTTSSNGAWGRVDVTAAGAVSVITGSNVWVSLDGLSFRIQ